MRAAWTNATRDGQWATAANWSTGRVPSPGDEVDVDWGLVPDGGIRTDGVFVEGITIHTVGLTLDPVSGRYQFRREG